MKRVYKVLIGCLVGACVLVTLFFGVMVFAWRPTKMLTPPTEEWKSTWILPFIRVDSTNLVFVGGVSRREPLIVYELRGPIPDLKGFRGENEDCTLLLSYRIKRAAEYFGFPFEMSIDSEVFSKLAATSSDAGLLFVVRSSHRNYVIYMRI